MNGDTYRGYVRLIPCEETLEKHGGTNVRAGKAEEQARAFERERGKKT
jgi:hypothetical protein